MKKLLTLFLITPFICLGHEKKKNAKLSVQIENADFRVEMEVNHRIQIQNENHELTYQLKEEKAINAD